MQMEAQASHWCRPMALAQSQVQAWKRWLRPFRKPPLARYGSSSSVAFYFDTSVSVKS
jgi:hypothetical protein